MNTEPEYTGVPKNPVTKLIKKQLLQKRLSCAEEIGELRTKLAREYSRVLQKEKGMPVDEADQKAIEFLKMVDSRQSLSALTEKRVTKRGESGEVLAVRKPTSFNILKRKMAASTYKNKPSAAPASAAPASAAPAAAPAAAPSAAPAAPKRGIFNFLKTKKNNSAAPAPSKPGLFNRMKGMLTRKNNKATFNVNSYTKDIVEKMNAASSQEELEEIYDPVLKSLESLSAKRNYRNKAMKATATLKEKFRARSKDLGFNPVAPKSNFNEFAPSWGSANKNIANAFGSAAAPAPEKDLLNISSQNQAKKNTAAAPVPAPAAPPAAPSGTNPFADLSVAAQAAKPRNTALASTNPFAGMGGGKRKRRSTRKH